MTSRHRLVFSLWLVFWASTCFTTPSAAGETAALSAKIDALSHAGKYAEAAALAQGQLQAMQKKYGPVHRDVAAAMNNLAQLYGELGNDAEAEPLFKQAIAILEQAMGLDSSMIAAELTNLAALYQREERYADAEPLFRRALAIRQKIARARSSRCWAGP
jgi:tetratricopeptide (TPR) repeat protein